MIAIVLAAGESRRMGRPKQLLPFGEGTVLRRVVANILAAEVGPVLVVLGHRAEEIAASLDGLAEPWVVGLCGGGVVTHSHHHHYPSDANHFASDANPTIPLPHYRRLAQCIYNPDYRAGMLSSVQAGVRAALPLLPGEEREGFLFCLGDQPQVCPETYRHTAAAFAESDAGIVLPLAAGRRGHPAAYSAGYAREILSLGPEASLREILRRHPDDVADVAVDDRGVTEDLDTPEDYQRLLHRPAFGGG